VFGGTAEPESTLLDDRKGAKSDKKKIGRRKKIRKGIPAPFVWTAMQRRRAPFESLEQEEHEKKTGLEKGGKGEKISGTGRE